MLPVEYYKYTHGILLSHKKNNNKILPLARTWMKTNLWCDREDYTNDEAGRSKSYFSVT